MVEDRGITCWTLAPCLLVSNKFFHAILPIFGSTSKGYKEIFLLVRWNLAYTRTHKNLEPQVSLIKLYAKK